MGRTLWTRWLWLKRTDPTRQWAQLPCREDPETEAFFKASIRCVVGNGRSTLFWSDPWFEGECICALAPDLTTAVTGRQWKRITVESALHSDEWLRDIQGVLTVPVLIQYIQLRERLQTVHLDPVTEDRMVWRVLLGIVFFKFSLCSTLPWSN
jgi:hypothetical protein